MSELLEDNTESAPSEGDSSGTSGWRKLFKIHPACALFPAMSPDGLLALGKDIKANGLREPIKYVYYDRQAEQYLDWDFDPFDDDNADFEFDLVLIDGRNTAIGWTRWKWWARWCPLPCKS